VRVIVTGGAGFIGSHVVERLLERGNSVLCVDNLDKFYDPREKLRNMETAKKSKRFTFVKLDIRSETLPHIFKKFEPDGVIHLAAKAGVRNSLEIPEEYASVNVLGTVNVLEASRANDAKVVFASSSSVYGQRTKASEKKPFKEDGPTRPHSPYAASKKAGEVYVQTYRGLYGIDRKSVV